jgi:hypothetical protein
MREIQLKLGKEGPSVLSKGGKTMLKDFTKEARVLLKVLSEKGVFKAEIDEGVVHTYKVENMNKKTLVADYDFAKGIWTEYEYVPFGTREKITELANNLSA